MYSTKNFTFRNMEAPDKLGDVPDYFHEIGPHLTPRSLASLSQINRRSHRWFEDTWSFWQKKFRKDFGKLILNTDDWKKAYLKYGKTWVSSVAGLEPLSTRFLRVVAGNGNFIGMDLEHDVFGWGDNYLQQVTNTDTEYIDTPMPLNIKAHHIAAGKDHILILNTDHRVQAFGSNVHGQTQSPRIEARKIAAGGDVSACIDRKNSLWMWGQNNTGQLGRGHNNESNSAQKVPDLKIKQVAIGVYHVLAIDLENNLWAWGDNEHGQLGLGEDVDEVFIPTNVPGLKVKRVVAGTSHSLAIDVDDNLWVWGLNQHGQLGMGEDTDIQSTPQQFPDFKALQIAAGNYHSIVIDDDNTVWVTGDNSMGQLCIAEDTLQETYDFVQYDKPGFKGFIVSASGNATIIIGN